MSLQNQVVAIHNLLKKSLLIQKCLCTIDHVVKIKLLARRTRSEISQKKSRKWAGEKTTTTLLFYSKCNLWSGIQVTFCYYSESGKSYTQCNQRAVTHVMCQLLLKGKLCNILTLYSWACELLWCLKGVQCRERSSLFTLTCGQVLLAVTSYLHCITCSLSEMTTLMSAS